MLSVEILAYFPIIGFSLFVLIEFDRFWKKQLSIAKDARRVDVLCYRIYLCYRLLDGTSRFRELYEIIKEAKAKLETDVGPVNGVSAKMARGIVSRLSVAVDVQLLCSQAIEKADEWLATKSSAAPNLGGITCLVKPALGNRDNFCLIYWIRTWVTFIRCVFSSFAFYEMIFFFSRGFTASSLQVPF